MILAMKLDERSKKVLLVLCALFIIVLLIFGGIYYLISSYMKKQSKKMDTYMYDLLKYGIVTNKRQFKKALIYHEKRYVYNSSKWPFRLIVCITALAIGAIYIFFDGNFKGFFSEVFTLFPKLKWPTIKDINASITDETLKLVGPGWLPASIFPTIISKHPDFSSPLLYGSTIYYVCILMCMFALIKSTLAFIARYKRGIKMSSEVFEKDLDKIDLSMINTFANQVNSPVPNQSNYQIEEDI